MTSYHRRYADGEHEAVWAELRALGPVPDALREDVAAVAESTMLRADRQIGRIEEQLAGLGFVPAWLVRERPTGDCLAALDRLAAEIGRLPAAYEAGLRVLGGVSFVGDCAALGLGHRYPAAAGPPRHVAPLYPDPLWLPSVECLREEWEEYRKDAGEYPDLPPEDGFHQGFPDTPHRADGPRRANVSGAGFDLALPDDCADPVVDGVGGRPGITLVGYLRTSIAWGGFPGWSFAAPERVPPALAALRARPDF
ncbi:hypothetical protein AB0D08_23370 [Kitasatospora sp. NPDC048540]|uniref:hypothetical protein n=1 Tax=unclassified Kitasatospora TaxID=2633591 RepID=UPI000539EA29|nr:hypothetical protein [Kitasatospora sp. MBT63]